MKNGCRSEMPVRNSDAGQRLLPSIDGRDTNCDGLLDISALTGSADVVKGESTQLERHAATAWAPRLVPPSEHSSRAFARPVRRMLLFARLPKAANVAVILLAACCSSLYGAESIDVPVRPSERSLESPGFLPDKAPDGFVLPAVPELPSETPVGGAVLHVSGIAFEGNQAIPTEELLAIAQPFVGRKVTASDIEELRHQITRHYISKGYINSGATLQEGAFRDGRLTFHIVEGRLEAVRLIGMERLRDSYLRGRLSHGNEPLNVNVLQERFQLLLTDPLFAKMNARLSPGSIPGEATLDVDVTRARPYQLSVFANNYRPPSIGAESYGGNGWIRNLTGFGDLLDATYQDGRGGGRYAVGWTVPVASYGTQFQARYEDGNSALLEESLKAVDIRSDFKSLEVNVSHPLIETLRQRLALGFSWANRESSTTLLGEPFSFTPGEPDGRTKLRVWRLFQDYLQRWEQSVLAVRSTFSFGRNNIMQEPSLDQTPKAHSFVWLGQLQYAHRVMDNGAQLVLRGVIQQTRDRLVPLERLAIGGVGTVRGYRENQVVRDKGYAGSVEFHYPLFGPSAPQRSLDAIAFVDHGAARNRSEKREHLSSVGVGLNGRYGGLAVELYLAKRLHKLTDDSGSNLQDKGVHLQIRYDMF